MSAAKKAASESSSRRKLSSTEFLACLKRAKDALSKDACDPLLALKNEGITSPLLVIGSDDLRCKRLARWFEESFFDQSSKAEVERVSCAELSNSARLDSFLISLQSLSLFANTRLIVLSQPDALRVAPAKRLGEALSKQSTSIFILILATAPAKKTEKKIPLVDNLPTALITVEMSDFSPQELRSWLEKELVRHGHHGGITPDASKVIADSYGLNLALISQELGKIALLVEPETKIDRRLIEENLPTGSEHTSFELVNAIAVRNLIAAEDLLHNLLVNGQHPLQISSFLSRAFRTIMFKIATRNDNAAATKSPELSNSWFVRNLSGAVSRYSEERLHETLNIMADLDLALKSSGTPPELTISLTLPKLVAQSGARRA